LVKVIRCRTPVLNRYVAVVYSGHDESCMS
jgi:hypothetical protein